VSPRVGVVGHVEWVDFAVVDRLPAAGEIVVAREAFADAGGGGGVAAVQLARLCGRVELLCALGSDHVARAAAERLRARGVTLHAMGRDQPQPRAVAHLADDGERTITVLAAPLGPRGADPLPWELAGRLDGVYVTAGDGYAVRRARAAKVLVATPRAAPGLTEAGVRIDALVLSDGDAHERGIAERLDPAPALIARTQGARGGAWERRDGAAGRWEPAPLPGAPVDAFGCGDSFAAALTAALAAGAQTEAALAYAARAGAAALCGRGPYGGAIEAIGAPA
jgi:ribokinase